MSQRDATFPLEQYRALRDGGGFVALADWSSVTLTGGDRQTFLNNFCTNEVKRLRPGENCEAFVTNVKGKIVGHGLVSCRDDELVLITVPGQSPRLIEHLDRYVIREDVQLRDTTAERAYLLLPDVPAVLIALAELSAALEGHSPRVIFWNMVNVPLSILAEFRPEDADRLYHALAKNHVVICGRAAFEAVRMEAGFPLFDVDFDGRNLPQEVDRNEQAISFTKGCYLGQETVARIDALGHVNQRLAGVRFAASDVPQTETELTQGDNTVGRVTSAVYSPRLDAPLALAMVRRVHLAPGSRLESAAGPCEVITLPVRR